MIVAADGSPLVWRTIKALSPSATVPSISKKDLWGATAIVGISPTLGLF